MSFPPCSKTCCKECHRTYFAGPEEHAGKHWCSRDGCICHVDFLGMVASLDRIERLLQPKQKDGTP
jgi:hypothetical protein